MVTSKPRKERLTIYLVNNSSASYDKVIKTENSKEPIALNINNGSAVLFVKKELPVKPPPWTKLFTANQSLPENIFGKSNTVGAALVIKEHKHLFVLTFGSGFHLLKNESIERDFGLRVTLNSVDPDKLRSLDKASYDHNPLNSRTQSAKGLDVFELHVDSELDMLYAVTGASKVDIFGSHVTGRDALTLMVEIELNGISKILEKALNKYKAELPKEFEWVENIHRIKENDRVELLDMELDGALLQPLDGNLWLGEPEVIDWELQIGYSFDQYQKTPRHVVLELKDLIDYLALHDKPLTVETLKEQSIHINDSEYVSVKKWTAYRCLYAEISVGAEYYILRNGIWYCVNTDFLRSIDNYLEGIFEYSCKLPTYNHDREEDYNYHVASQDNSFVLIDKKNIRIGGPYDKLEFCDLIKDDSDFIHVKYYRSSATLSHLFSQGFVAAEAFVTDREFRKELNHKLPDCMKLENINQRPDPSKYRVIYAIATSKTLPNELPFFSKVTLKNAIKKLRALDYKIGLTNIEVNPTLLVKKKGKPQKKTKSV